MLRIIGLHLRYHWDAHRSNLPNLIAGAGGMFLNNVLFLLGMWGMLFAGKPENQSILVYYIALNSVVMASWGFVCFFFGGLRDLAELIESGTLESVLATPRSPLVLAGMSRSHVVSFGDLVMGIGGVTCLYFFAGFGVGLRSTLATLMAIFGFSGLFIAASSLVFFVTRSSAVSNLLIEIMLSLSVFPSGKIFSGQGRILLFLTPAAATAILPMSFVEGASVLSFCAATVAALGFFGLSCWIFGRGLRRYRAMSLIGART